MAQDSTLAPVSGAWVTVAVLQIGMKRVTTTNAARYLCIDKSGKSNCTMRITANVFNAWEQKILVLQVGETRMYSPSLELQAVSADAPANAAHAAVDLVSAKTESIIPETALQVMPLTGLDGSCVLVSEVLKRSIEHEEII
jgi:hypothetical protein